MILGYNTNGMAHHHVFDAVRLLAEIGYRSVAISIDHGVLAPYDPACDQQREMLHRMMRELAMDSVIETGARFLLDPRVKHEPTLVSADPARRARRIAFYRHAIHCAAELGSRCVSIFSGVLREPAPEAEVTARLVAGLAEVLEEADRAGVLVAFEPEPGMFVDRLAGFDRLLDHPELDRLKLTLDIGHWHCQGEAPIEEVLSRYADRLLNVHIEDMRVGRHEHLMFGEGEIDFPRVLDALAQSAYDGPLHVELSRHAHDAPEAARRAYTFLRQH